jgi:aminoglycoside phosphotransferase (APT) family kinase protein
MSGSAPDQDRLAAAAGRHLGRATRIADLRRLSGGASRETWSFDALTEDGTRHALVLRRDPSGYPGGSDRAVEFDLLRTAFDGGVAVPRVWFLLEDGDDLGSGFVMERIEGETIARKILRDDQYAPARPRLARQCGEQAARIHALEPAVLPPLHVDVPQTQLARYLEFMDGFGEPHPAFELAFRALDAHPPSGPEHPRLVHGDFRNGNLVVGPEGLRAVLDWELAHLGDPVEDLGWLCVKSWRFGVSERPVGGFGDVDELIAGYRAGGGGDVDPETLAWWELFGTLKWGVICQVQASAHLSGAVRSVELAALGRRVAETEWDLLELIT